MTDTEFRLVQSRLLTLTGMDLDAYKSVQVRRRLDNYLTRLRIPSWAEFAQQLNTHPEMVQQLCDYIAINVSSFFRDRMKWRELRDKVLPTLGRPGQTLRVWSAACSHGAEPYSLAMLLEEQGLHRRYQVVGTDIDRAALQQARAGGPYLRDEVREVEPEILAKYFKEESDRYWVTPPLRSKVEFAELNLLQIQHQSVFDLILCRNVLIYLTESAKRQVLAGLAGALKPDGILFVGATESVSHETSLGLARAGLCFYRRASQTQNGRIA